MIRLNKFESKYFETSERMDEAFLDLLEQKDFEYITVKEICRLAGVNRSTFYLHYESLGDLLEEACEYVSRKVSSYFDESLRVQNVAEVPQAELFFVTQEYLVPWLTCIKENRRLYQTILKKNHVLGMDLHHNSMTGKMMDPILDRYGIPRQNQKYLLAYYAEGIIAIVKIWLQEECERPIEEMAQVIMDCVRYPQNR